VTKQGHPQIEGAVEVSVDCHGDDAAVVEATFKDAGARELHSK
jgi:hypothetical protein